MDGQREQNSRDATAALLTLGFDFSNPAIKSEPKYQYQISLHDKQEVAFLTLATEVLYGGAAGGGKSHLMRSSAIYWSIEIPGLQTYLFRRTFPDLYKNHMTGPAAFPALLAELVNLRKVHINYSDNRIFFGNGSTIHLCHCQHAKDVFGYQGAEMHLLMIDELTQFEWAMYAYLRGRCRIAGLPIPEKYKGLFPRILAASNPGGVCHNEVKQQFVDLAAPLAITQMPRDEGGMKRIFVPALLEDNPTLMENDPDYEMKLEGLGDPALVHAMRWGDWNIVSGGMFDDIWMEQQDKIIVAPFKVPESWEVDRSFDWGSSAPFSVGWWAESDGTDVTLADGTKKSTVPGDLYRIAEWYGWNGRANKGCKMLSADIARGILEREEELGLDVEPGPADSSIFSREDGHCIADEMAEQGVTWTRADKSPGSRENGWQKLRSMLKNTGSREEPGLHVFEHCRHFIRTIPTLPRSDTKPEDVNTNAEDHVGDETRYRIFTKRHTMERRTIGGL